MPGRYSFRLALRHPVTRSPEGAQRIPGDGAFTSPDSAPKEIPLGGGLTACIRATDTAPVRFAFVRVRVEATGLHPRQAAIFRNTPG